MFTRHQKFNQAVKAMALAVIFFTLLTSCKDDEDVIAPLHVVQFFASSQLFSENDTEQIIKITLDKPSTVDGHVKLRITTDDTGRFTSNPEAIDGIITLPIEKGQGEIQLKIKPTNNSVVDDDATITFTLIEASEGFILGSVINNEMTIADDEDPVKANFLFNIASVRENRTAGLDAVIFFSGFTESAGHLTVGLESTSATYGTDFITEPAAVNGKIEFEVASESDYVFFKFLPVNDALITGDMGIRFTLEKAAGGVQIGETKIMDLTLLDDESFPISHVEDVRGLYSDEEIILDNIFIVGVVTSVADNIGQTTTYIEDETGGIGVRLIFSHNFHRGDKLKLNLGYGLLKETKGVLEVHQVSEAEKIGTSQFSHQLMTMEELYNSEEENEGKMVVIDEITFIEADGLNTMQGDRLITDGAHSIIVRTLDHASFKDQIIPAGDMIVRGILTEVDDTFILYPQVFAEDVVPSPE